MYFKLKTAKRGKQKNFFVLHANNGEPVGTSEMYSTEQAAKQGAAAMLKAAAEYWKVAFATLIEEKAQSVGEEEGRLISIPEISRLLLELDNNAMQNIIDRMPFETK